MPKADYEKALRKMYRRSVRQRLDEEVEPERKRLYRKHRKEKRLRAYEAKARRRIQKDLAIVFKIAKLQFLLYRRILHIVGRKRSCTTTELCVMAWRQARLDACELRSSCRKERSSGD